MNKLRELYYYDFPHFLEKLQMDIAWKMPRWLVKFCTVRCLAHATTGKYSDTVVPELSALDALKRWDK